MHLYSSLIYGIHFKFYTRLENQVSFCTNHQRIHKTVQVMSILSIIIMTISNTNYHCKVEYICTDSNQFKKSKCVTQLAYDINESVLEF